MIDYAPKKKQEVYQKFARTWVKKPLNKNPLVTECIIRVTPILKSRATPGGSTALKPVQQYSGTKMLGVSTLHKSNSVPVFSKEEIVDISKMRR